MMYSRGAFYKSAEKCSTLLRILEYTSVILLISTRELWYSTRNIPVANTGRVRSLTAKNDTVVCVMVVVGRFVLMGFSFADDLHAILCIPTFIRFSPLCMEEAFRPRAGSNVKSRDKPFD